MCVHSEFSDWTLEKPANAAERGAPTLEVLTLLPATHNGFWVYSERAPVLRVNETKQNGATK